MQSNIAGKEAKATLYGNVQSYQKIKISQTTPPMPAPRAKIIGIAKKLPQ
jgi:hypothetical protein